MAAVTSSSISTASSVAGVTCLSHLEWNLLDSLFVGFLWILFFCLSRRTNSCKPDCFVNVLEECDLVALVLILTLVLVGRLPPEFVAVKIDFTSFLIFNLSFLKLLYSRVRNTGK
jgi:hypothetical protein